MPSPAPQTGQHPPARLLLLFVGKSDRAGVWKGEELKSSWMGANQGWVTEHPASPHGRGQGGSFLREWGTSPSQPGTAGLGSHNFPASQL